MRRLQGREREVQILRSVLQQARARRGRALVVRGELGIGKTALLELSGQLAHGFRILRAAGVEAESAVAFAGLHELFGPVTGLLARLPSRQRGVLEGALAVGPAVSADPLAVRAATLGLIAAAAKQAPLLLLVDDAQWLDPASAACLAFAARRLGGERAAAVVTIRDEEATAFDSGGLTELRLRPLSDVEAGSLLDGRLAPHVTPDVRRRLIALAAGNPLALVELPGGLDREGREPLVRPLEVGHAVEAVFAPRVERLPPRTRQALLLAAAGEPDRRRTLAAALQAQQLGPRTLDPAEQAGLVAGGAGRIAFRHPLVRSAVYQIAPVEDRRAAHRALAASAEGSQERAWHLAAAATEPDAAVAAALAAAAREAAQRGGLLSAARSYERAAELFGDAVARAELLLSAAGCARAGGRIAWASALLADGRASAAGVATVADYRQLEAQIERDRGSVRIADALLRTAADDIAAADRRRAATISVEATIAQAMQGDLRAAAHTGERALRYAGTGPAPVRALARMARDLVAGFRGELTAAEAAVDEMRGCLERSQDVPAPIAAASDLLWTSWTVHVGSERPGSGTRLTALIAQRRQENALALLPFLVGYDALDHINRGSWDRARALAGEAVDLADGIGQATHRPWGLILLAWLDAAQGRAADCRRRVAEAAGLAARSEAHYLQVWHRAVLGLLDLGEGHAAAAAAGLQDCARLADECGLGHPNAIRYEADLVEALLAAGEPGEARTTAARLSRRAERVASPWGRAVAARGRALLATDDRLDSAFHAALAAHNQVPSSFERARTRLCYGERLRRTRRSSDARPHLAAALTTFDELGAVPWAARARRELAAAGARPVTTAGSTQTLTPQELRVALIMAEGATVREAAAQLFLSPKTIEAHLGRTYRKLAVKNRAQLAGALRDVARDEPG